MSNRAGPKPNMLAAPEDLEAQRLRQQEVYMLQLEKENERELTAEDQQEAFQKATAR